MIILTKFVVANKHIVIAKNIYVANIKKLFATLNRTRRRSIVGVEVHPHRQGQALPPLHG